MWLNHISTHSLSSTLPVSTKRHFLFSDHSNLFLPFLSHSYKNHNGANGMFSRSQHRAYWSLWHVRYFWRPSCNPTKSTLRQNFNVFEKTLCRLWKHIRWEKQNRITHISHISRKKYLVKDLLMKVRNMIIIFLMGIKKKKKTFVSFAQYMQYEDYWVYPRCPLIPLLSQLKTLLVF